MMTCRYRLRVCVVRALLLGVGIGIVTDVVFSNVFNVAISSSTSCCGDGGVMPAITMVDGFVVSPQMVRSLRQRQQQHQGQGQGRGQIIRRAKFLFATNSDNEGEQERSAAEPTKKKKKKSKKLVINPNLNRDSFAGGGVATISSDGVVEVSPKLVQRREKSNKLGVPSKHKMKDNSRNGNNNNSGKNKRLSAKALKLKNQRTAGGLVDSTSSSKLSSSKFQSPQEEEVRIAIGKRGSKVVTMIQGMTLTTMEDRKKLLKALKGKVGGGGTLVDGVLELQGPHTETALQFLKSKGYTKTKIVGGGGRGKGKKK